MSPSIDLEQVLRQRFGLASFRPGQREAIEELLSGGCLLCIQPTGHGKSLLYQLPATLLEGITVVVSPLLALMRDQIQQLRQRFGIRAASVNSDQDEAENERARDQAARGELQLLFVSPEHLDNLDRFEALCALPVSLLVVDEAHCISTWGHDFRPAYRQILQFLHRLRGLNPSLKVLGLTATADARTEADIRGQLQEPGRPPMPVHRRSMDRPNIRLAVVDVDGLSEKLDYLTQLLPRLPGPGLLYCATREHTELVADYLRRQGQEVAAYHAGMEPERKRELQSAFLAGSPPVIAATNALGMGIDKSDLRFIVHVDMPGSITAYYQEVGRCGRDGQPARGILLYDPRDRSIQEHFIRSAQPEPEDFQEVLHAVREAGELGLQAIKARSGLHPTRATIVVAELVEQGFLGKRSSRGKQVYECLGSPRPSPELERYARQFQVRTRELDSMVEYAERRRGCLMACLRQALGDGGATSCGRCSVCQPRASLFRGGDAGSPARAWLQERPAIIEASSRPEMGEGLALFDGELRGDAYLEFMRNRAASGRSLSPELASLIRRKLLAWPGVAKARSVVLVPSGSWAQRAEMAALLGEWLGLPVFAESLVWKKRPPLRQGELKNNDQRRENVAQSMGWSGPSPALPEGALLLIDDFVGSGATLKEAGRALRKEAKHQAAILPLTIARVRWRLGSVGMVPGWGLDF